MGIRELLEVEQHKLQGHNIKFLCRGWHEVVFNQGAHKGWDVADGMVRFLRGTASGGTEPTVWIGVDDIVAIAMNA